MCGKHNIDTSVNQIFKAVQKSAELLFFVNISVSVAEIFNAFLAVLCTDVINAKLFCPVDCINNNRLAYSRIAFDIFKLTL